MFLIKVIRTVQNSTNYTSYNISITFDRRTRQIGGFGLPALPPRCFEEIEEEKAERYKSFASLSSGGGVWLNDGGVIPLNDEITQFLNQLIISFINDPTTHRPKDAEGRWLPMKKQKEGEKE